MTDYMTTTGVADYYTAQGYPLKPWQVRRPYERGLVPEPTRRAGTYRLIAPDDLPRLEQALRQLGYLPDDAVVQ